MAVYVPDWALDGIVHMNVTVPVDHVVPGEKVKTDDRDAMPPLLRVRDLSE